MRKISIFVLICVFVGMSGCAKAPTEDEMAKWNFGPYPYEYEQIIKDAMVSRLFDPYSAQYHFQGKPEQRWMARPLGQKTEYGWGGVVLINAKNRMGGYVGATPFAYLIRHDKLVLLEENFNMK